MDAHREGVRHNPQRSNSYPIDCIGASEAMSSERKNASRSFIYMTRLILSVEEDEKALMVGIVGKPNFMEVSPANPDFFGVLASVFSSVTMTASSVAYMNLYSRYYF